MAEAAHQRFIATTWSVSPDDKERPVKKSIFRRCRSGRWHVAPSELRSIARRQGASREEELFLFFFFFFFFPHTHTHHKGRQTVKRALLARHASLNGGPTARFVLIELYASPGPCSFEKVPMYT